MHCPHCTTKMRPIVYEGVTVNTCSGCGGEFIGATELAAIVQTREMVFGPHLRQLFANHQPVHGIPTHEVDRKLDCPDCDGTLEIVNYSSDTGICIDRCQQCGGVWLDSQELEKIQIILENWHDQAPEQLCRIAEELERTRKVTASRVSKAFSASRFAFVNAVINRLLDAA